MQAVEEDGVTWLECDYPKEGDDGDDADADADVDEDESGSEDTCRGSNKAGLVRQ